MAVRKFILSFGQSNAAPTSDYASWIALKPELNLDNVTTRTIGVSENWFTIPGGIPGYGDVNLQGLAVRNIRYLTFYNPLVTGYRTYPHTGRLTAVSTPYAHTTTQVYVEQKWPASGSPTLTITRELTRTVHTVTTITAVTPGLPGEAGCLLTVTPAFSPAPVNGEEFSYPITAATGSGATVVLSLSFGLFWDGKLTGLKLTCTSGPTTANVGESRIIQSWVNSTRTATLASAFPAAIDPADQFTLSPPVGAFDAWALWLPWTKYEAATTSGKANPFPPGFDFPNHYHIPQDYRPVGGIGGGNVPVRAAYHIGLVSRFSDFYGEDVYCLACDFGGTMLARTQLSIGAGREGWFDPAQQSNWAQGQSNNCYARLSAELDAAIVAAASQGDTLQCIGAFFPQGETDAGQESAAGRYAVNLRTLKAGVRQMMVTKGLWSEAADRFPFVQPQIDTDYWTYGNVVNAAISTVAEEDPYSDSFSVDDLPKNAADMAHYSGVGATMLEARCWDSWYAIHRAKTIGASVVLDVCNLALTHIGETARVTSIDPSDGSAQATLCARYYPIARDSILEMRQWGFAMRRRSPGKIVNVSSAWSYAYAVPGDAAKVVSVQSQQATADYRQPSIAALNTADPTIPYGISVDVPQEFTIEQRPDGSRVLLTNIDDAEVRYVARATDPTAWPYLFRLALSWHLGSMLAGPIIKGDEGSAAAKRCVQMAMMFMAQASEADAVGHRAKPIHRAPWTAGR